jgi:hypothetical protein
MTQTKVGAMKAVATTKKRHGKDFYKKAGKAGGTKSRNCGFASNKVGADGLTGRERAGLAGSVGGKKSRRGLAKVKAFLIEE